MLFYVNLFLFHLKKGFFTLKQNTAVMAISVLKNWVTIAMKNLGCHVQSLSRIRKFIILSDKAALNVPWHQLHFQVDGDNLK